MLAEDVGNGGVLPAIMNAADEVAVDAFLSGRIRFPEIPAVISEVMNSAPVWDADSLSRVLEADQQARERAAEVISALSPLAG